MTDQLVRQLTRELGLRATDMTGDLTLAPRVLQRAKAVRRRRTAGVSIAAGVAVATVAAAVFVGVGPSLRGADGPTPPPATRTTADSSLPAPSAGAPTVGYVVNGGPSRATLARRSVVHLAGRTIPLPAGWWVQRMIPSGTGLLLDVVEPDEGEHAVYVGAGGAVKAVPGLAPGPMAANRDGSVVLDTLQLQIAGELRFVEVPSGTVVDTASGAPLDAIPLGLTGPRAVLVSEEPSKQLTIWRAPGGGRSAVQTPMPGSSPLWPVTDTDQSGLVLSVGDQGIRLQQNDFRHGWTFTSTKQDQLQLQPEFSPDGTRIAAITDDQLLLLRSAQGVSIRSRPLPATGGYAGLAWEDAANVLIEYRGPDSDPQRISLVRCSTQSLRCTPIATTGYLVLPSS